MMIDSDNLMSGSVYRGLHRPYVATDYLVDYKSQPSVGRVG